MGVVDTEENYLLKEMGHRVARKHASKLRVWSVGLGLVLPLLLLGAIWLGDLTRPGGAILALLAALSATLGALIERWLFFAEATHKVTLYYGAKAV